MALAVSIILYTILFKYIQFSSSDSYPEEKEIVIDANWLIEQNDSVLRCGCFRSGPSPPFNYNPYRDQTLGVTFVSALSRESSELCQRKR